MPSRTTVKISLYVLFVVFYGFIYAGLWFPEPYKPEIFNFTWRYFICILFLAFVFVIPWLFVVIKRKIGTMAFLSICTTVFSISFLLYLISAGIYYKTQRHLFDPFLQISAEEIHLDKKKDPDVYRILLLGSSNTRCFALDEKDRYPYRLQRLLQERYPNLKVQVINNGMDWFTSKHSLISYVTYAQDWNPDLVIYMGGINDLYRSFSPPMFSLGAYNDQYTHFYGPAIFGAHPPTFSQYLFSRMSFMQRLVKSWFYTLRYKEVDMPLSKFSSLTAHWQNLQRLAKVVQGNKSKLMLVTEPFLYKEHMENDEMEKLIFSKTVCLHRIDLFHFEYPSVISMKRAAEAYNDNIRNIANLMRLPIVEAQDAIPKNLENFRDDTHFTTKGAQNLAQLVSMEIFRNQIIEKDRLKK